MQLATSAFTSLICSCQAMQRTPAQSVGCFKLPPRQVLTLTIRAAGELRLAHGQAWVTFANAADDATVRAGDHFLQAGEVLKLARGQQVVMESLQTQPDSAVNASVYFSWVPDSAVSRAVLPRAVQSAHIDVRQPLRDLGHALHLAGNALGRLVQGLAAGLAGALVPHHSPTTCTAQCLTIRN